jgi:hypothetical protein
MKNRVGQMGDLLNVMALKVGIYMPQQLDRIFARA